MSELTEKLVTAEFLKQFGDKCKQIFSQAPICGDGNVLQLPEVDLDNCGIFIQFEGYRRTDNKSILLFIQFIDNASITGSCISLGDITPTTINFIKCSDPNAVFVEFKTTDNPEQYSVSAKYTYFTRESGDDNWQQQFIKDAIITRDVDDYTVDNYYHLDPSLVSGSIGTIKVLGSKEFTILDKDGDEITYPTYTYFDSISSASTADKFSTEKTITYGTTSDDVKTDFSDNTISLPLPSKVKLSIEGTNIDTKGTYVSLKIVDGDIVATQENSIQVANQTNIGGIKVYSDSGSSGNQQYVYLNKNNFAYVNVPSSIQADLSKKEASNNTGLIFQHIGITTDNLVNGYFYKSTNFNSNYTYSFDSYNSIYSISAKLSNSISLKIESGDISVPTDFKYFKLWVDPTDVQNNGDIKNFLLVGYNTTGNKTYNTLNVESLASLGIEIESAAKNLQFKKSSEYITFNNISYYNPLTLTKDIEKYNWQQQDTQPAVVATNEDFYLITNSDIDNIINPVQSVSLDKESAVVTPSSPQTLTATVSPDGANTAVTWSVDNNNVLLSSTTGKTITVTYKYTGQSIITVTTDYENKKATCTIDSKENA